MLSKNQIKEIQSLQLKKCRDAKKLFVAEGVKMVSEILKHAPKQIKEIFVVENFVSANRNLLHDLNLKFTEVTETELKKISLQSTPNGALAVCNYFEGFVENYDFDTHFSFYLDDVRDPGNLGTIIRLADWFGISVIFCSPNSCDLYNPKVVQSTMGAFLRVKLMYIELPELIKKYQVKKIYGAVLNGKNLYKEELQNGLIVIGNEANGISSENLNITNYLITIPANQNNGTESLNAAMAASIIASEFFRQLKVTY
jgi:TrmH family RNA methyltransferase